MDRSKKRDQLVETALQLFYRQGFHATGVDQIISEAGVARMTFYKYFPSKDDLIVATLRRRDEIFRGWLFGYIEKYDTARDQLLGLYDALDLWFQGKAFPEQKFSGCMFINATAEFSDQELEAHKVAAEHKATLKKQFVSIVEAAGFSAADELAAQLLLLKEGAIVTAQVTGDLTAAKRARKIAVFLLAAAQ
ncbi:TetR/AcrR family transcriptional regulator [Kiloniella antarctica]|uniref:TetR/AcrR family transcriptional regulator n=1 Tax=Kiloniella antarctica TaxID=1550907 RepID=A0ABW5BJB4_9PROT